MKILRDEHETQFCFVKHNRFVLTMLLIAQYILFYHMCKIYIINYMYLKNLALMEFLEDFLV